MNQMMRTAILVMVAAVALSAVAAPAQAVTGCESNEKIVEYKLCYRVDEDCIAVGGHIANTIRIMGYCP